MIMKKYFVIVLVALTAIIISCKKDKVADKIVGSYYVSSFVDNGNDKTAQFAAYVFKFENNGNMSIEDGSMMNMCSWTESNNIYHFNMSGMHSHSLDDFDDDWMMTSSNDSTCQFSDDNPNRNCTFVLHRK
jgi:hypothetical protein